MNLKVRRIIYITFIIIFLVISPLLISYALGYKYNFVKGRIEKTGVLFIKSYPKNSQIYLNEELQKRTTPTQLNRLLANNYEIKIVKEGYIPWTKTLPIYPQSTTFIEDVSLFKNNLEFTALAHGQYENLSISPDKTKLILMAEDKLASSLDLYNLLNNKKQTFYQSNNKLAIDSWCNTNNKVIIKEKSDHLIINTQSLNVSYLYSLTSRYFEHIECDYFNDNLFYGLKSGWLYKIDLMNRKISLLLNEKVIAFKPWQTRLLFISTVDGKYTLKSFLNDEVEDILVLPASKNYQFIFSDRKELALLDKDESIAYIINPTDEQPFKRVLKNVHNLRWYDKQLVYWNNSELWAYYPESDERILLERASQPIQNAFWHSAFSYVLSQTENILKAYELDSRDKRNIHELMTLPEFTQDNIFINKKGDKLYLITEVDGERGFYEVEIQ